MTTLIKLKPSPMPVKAVSWVDIFSSQPIGDVSIAPNEDENRYEYPAEKANSIRSAISGQIKLRHPEMAFETALIDGVFIVRRLK